MPNGMAMNSAYQTPVGTSPSASKLRRNGGRDARAWANSFLLHREAAAPDPRRRTARRADKAAQSECAGTARRLQADDGRNSTGSRADMSKSPRSAFSLIF